MTEVRSQTGQDDGIVGQAQEHVQQVAATAQEKAAELKDQGTSKLRDQLDSRSTEAGRQTRSLASSLRQSAGSLREDGSTTAASVAEGIADRLERAGGYLEQKRGEELMWAGEDFARRRPWAVAGLGMLAGLAAARFTKASSERRYTSRGLSYGRGGSAYPTPYAGTDSYVMPYAPAANETAPTTPHYPDRAVDAPLSRELDDEA